MYEQFVREMPEEIDKDLPWKWLVQSDLKVQTEATICAAQEQALRTKIEYYKEYYNRILKGLQRIKLRRHRKIHRAECVVKGEKLYSIKYVNVKN